MLSPLDDDPILKDIPLVEGWKVLPPVVLYAKIGQGGMGAVYRGRHLDFDIDVAVKCLKASLASEDEQFIARFKREARLAASLSHENLIRVYDSRRAHGLHYLVMEFVDGENLRARVTRKGPLEDFEAATILLGAARGLAKAHHHAETVVHRDVKPDNILISRRGEVKLADLGIAKALDQSDAATFNTQGVIGTPQYMAPEQWDRDQDLGPQADIWSFGATLYYMLTAESGIRSGTQKQIYVDVCQKPFPDVRRKRPDIHPELVAILDKCLQKDMNDRYADAGELAKALEAFIGHRPTTLDDPDTGSQGTIALVSPPPMPTMKRIRTHVELGTGEAATPAPQMTTILRRPRKKWPIVAGVAGVVIVGAIVAFKVFGTKGGGLPEGPVADATPPKLREASPKDREILEAGTPQQVKLFFDEELGSAKLSNQGGDFKAAGSRDKQTASFDLNVPNAAGEWNLQYEVTDVAGNTTTGRLLYMSAAKAPPKVPRILLNPPVSSQDSIYLKETLFALRGEIENPTELDKVTLKVGAESVAYPLTDRQFRIDYDQIPRDRTTKVRLEYGNESTPFEIVQDSQPPKIAFVKPAGGVLRTNVDKVDIEVKVTDSNLAQVELDQTKMVRADGDNWRMQGVELEREGDIYFEISATDKAGNFKKTSAVITRDTAKAKLQDISLAEGSEVEPGQRVPLTLSFNEELETARVDGKDTPTSGSSLKTSLTVPEGEGSWKVDYDVADRAGNHTSATLSYSRKSKPAALAPHLSIDLPLENNEIYVSGANLVVPGTVENPSGETASFIVDGKPVDAKLENGKLIGDLSLPLNKRSKVELKYGKTVVKTFTVIQDSKEPVITPMFPATADFLTKEKSIDLQVRVVEDNLRSVLLDSREMKLDSKGIWRVDGLALPRDETFPFEVVATDKAGHTARQTLAITRDTIAPSLSADSLPKEGTEFAAGAPVEATLVFDEAIAAVIVGGSETRATDRSVKLTLTFPDGESSWPLQGTVRDLAGNDGDFRLTLRRSPAAATPPLKVPENTGPAIAVKDTSAPPGWKILEAAAPGTRWAKKVQEPKSGIIFVLIEPGEFDMGSPTKETGRDKDEIPHHVKLTQAFYLAITETTQKQYKQVTTRNPSKFSGDDKPVENVSWADANSFCGLIGCELPTEAQWEYACRAGKTQPFSTSVNLTKLQANFNGDEAYDFARDQGKSKPLNVKSFPANDWQLFDMCGNVAEWCRDSEASYPIKLSIDPAVTGSSKHIIRGGGWMSPKSDCRSANRDRDEATAKDDNTGFRCSKTL